MNYLPVHFIDDPIEVEFDTPPTYEKSPVCPDRFTWQGSLYRITEKLGEWQDYERRGRMGQNMSQAHAATAARRGSWGVGRFYFRVRADNCRIYDIYYDRAPKDADDRKGSWFIYRELEERASTTD